MESGVERTSDDEALENIAEAFVQARRAGTALAEYPGIMPATLAAGYAVQDEAISLSGRTVAGWKVGRINPAVDGMNRLAGPIFSDQVVEAHDSTPAMPVFAEGFGAAEAEFLLRIGTAPAPGKTTFTLAEARALVDAVHVGIEIAGSPFPGINAHGPAVTIADFGNNNGLVIGPPAEGWQDAEINDWPVTLDVDGAEVGRATAATMLDGPFGAVRFIAEHLATRGIALLPGQWISTGAVTGVHKVKPGDAVVARFDDRFTVTCTIKAR
jgi:2-keto-4-pentenoate hydratase